MEAGLPEEHVQDLTGADDPEDTDCDDPPVHGAAVPEDSAPGESQSNGTAERAVQMAEGQVRTLLAA